jgi:2-oxoisovalerate dehydrogenase E1 component alpha subunit
MSDKPDTRRNRPALALHVPEPPFRPGDTPDFSSIRIPAAGEAPRPDMAAEAEETFPLCTQLVRVLDDKGKAVGPWDPRIDADTLRKMLKDMKTVRAFDERMFRGQRQGKTSFYMKCTGEEATSSPPPMALASDDMVFPSYRQQGILIARGYPLVEMINQIYSNRGDKLKGRQLPIMYSSREHSFFTISGNLATQCPQAVGWAMASAIKGDSRIAASWVGEGSTAEGDFHSALTFRRGLQRAGDPQRDQQPVGDLELLGFAGAERRPLPRGRSAMASPACGSTATTRWRSMPRALGRGPRARQQGADADRAYFTYRAEGHSTSDDPSGYRSAQEARGMAAGRSDHAAQGTT